MRHSYSLNCKTLAVSFFLLMMSSVLLAQTSKTSVKGLEGWNIDVGPTLAHPLKYLNMFSTFGVGVDGSITHPLPNGLAVGGRVNYAHFFGRSSALAGLVDESGRFPSSSMINILGDAHYTLPNKILFGVNLGLGMILYNGATGSGFADIIYGGYEWDQGAHIYTFSLYYDQTTYQKNLGVRAAIRL